MRGVGELVGVAGVGEVYLEGEVDLQGLLGLTLVRQHADQRHHTQAVDLDPVHGNPLPAARYPRTPAKATAVLSRRSSDVPAGAQ